MIQRLVVSLGIAALMWLPGCRKSARVTQREEVVWRTLGSWSGRGAMQTEPFISDTGSLRLTWQTTNEPAAGGGTFRVTLHSDVSGRPLLVAVDARGAGRDVSYVSEDPRSFFLVIDSAGLDWTLTAAEGFPATAAADR